MARRPHPPASCAQCGEAIPPRAFACPHCGADERTGWREADPSDGLDLPDHAWDAPPPSRPSPLPATLPWYWKAAALALAIWFILWITGTA